MTDPFDFQTRARRFAVIGNPVAHSLSPQIHAMFAAQFNITLEYARVQVDAGGFAQAVSHFAARGGAGMNVTVPFKLEAFQLCARRGNRLSARAKLAGAVNTLQFESAHAIFGDNTDGEGLVRDLEQNLHCTISGARVLLLGAGGAARGVAQPLLSRAPKSLTIANRTAHKARMLAKTFGGGMRGCGLDEVDGVYHLIVNASAASLHGAPPQVDAACMRGAFAYDLMYARAPTAFMQYAREAGAAHAVDGLGMLVEQAAESFSLWHGRRPETAAVLRELRA